MLRLLCGAVLLAMMGGAGAALTNLSTRGYVGTDDDVLIGGLIVSDGPVTVLLRARGPSIHAGAVPSSAPLSNPHLQLMGPDGLIDSNDNWRDHPGSTQVPVGLAPTHELESALVATLLPGAYTAIVSGADSATGVGIVEAFVLGEAVGKLENLSTRGFAGVLDEVLIGGFIVDGAGAHTLTLRARGPSIDPELVGGGRLANPVLQLFNGSTLLASNDNWQDGPDLTSIDPALQPSEQPESLLTATLAPGAYTVIASGMGGGTGIGIVEIFDRRPPTPNQPGREFYESSVEAPVIQARCSICHRTGLIAGHTRLTYLGSEEPGHVDANYQTLFDFITAAPDNADLVLSKATGQSHQGGAQIANGSDEYIALETFVRLIDVTGNADPAATFTAAVQAGATATLRRAALIVARRLPTTSELAGLGAGDDGALRTALRGLMQGPGFHSFLLDAANDRLHTDAFVRGLAFPLANLNNARLYPVGANRFFADVPTNATERAEKRFWTSSYRYGLARAPLELIAHVVENDLPYTNILTADYTMVNPVTSYILRSNVVFPDNDNQAHFLPGQNRGQVLRDGALRVNNVPGRGVEVLSHGPFVEYPHAGVLNSLAFLNRYPTTETNRNRARARWAYYHFLGVDIEQSAPRTTDPDALADTNNPTMNNPACTVCHGSLDPVAGAFQNYGNDGFYRDRQGGLDALPPTYKFPRFYDDQAEPSPYLPGDTWFRDMHPPGFEGMYVPDADHSLAWLALRIVDDPRFDTAAVRFWWPALMGTDPIDAPQVETDPDYPERLAAFINQDNTISGLGQEFASGIRGRAPYNARDLLVEMMMTPWFRTAGILDSSDALPRDAGTRRLLTPAELEAKTAALIGWPWGARPQRYDLNGVHTALVDQFRIYYGGIDSNGILDRARELTALMANVAERHAIAVACPAAAIEFTRPSGERRLFPGVEADTTPEADVAAVRRAIVHLHQLMLGEVLAPEDDEVSHTLGLLTTARTERRASEHSGRAWGQSESCTFPPGSDLPLADIRRDPEDMKFAWASVLIYLMTDFRYLHE